MFKFVFLFLFPITLFSQARYTPLSFGGITEMGGVFLESPRVLEDGNYIVVCEIGKIKMFDTLKVYKDEGKDLWFPGLGVYFYGEYLNAINRQPKEELIIGPSDLDSLLSKAKWKIRRVQISKSSGKKT